MIEVGEISTIYTNTPTVKENSRNLFTQVFLMMMEFIVIILGHEIDKLTFD